MFSSLIRGAGGVRRHGILVRPSFVKILSYSLLSTSAFFTCCYFFAINFEYWYSSRVPSFCSDVRPEFLADFEFGSHRKYYLKHCSFITSWRHQLKLTSYDTNNHTHNDYTPN